MYTVDEQDDTTKDDQGVPVSPPWLTDPGTCCDDELQTLRRYHHGFWRMAQQAT
jgi:hypothetical protein